MKNNIILFISVVSVLGALTACSPSSKTPLTVASVPITMRDGVRLAVDVIRPVTNVRLPTILIQTRYWRSFGFRFSMPSNQFPPGPRDSMGEVFVANGYAVVIADVRGTGASEGVWPHAWSEEEVKDSGDLIRWIASQPWSDGQVGTYGVSYEGTKALLSAVHGGPALKAALAREIEWSPFEEIIAPGGVLVPGFLKVWDESVTALDANRYPPIFPVWGKWIIRGVRPLDGDSQSVSLSNILSKRKNPGVWDSISLARRAEDFLSGQKIRVGDLGPAGYAKALSQSAAKLGVWGGYHDGFTAAAVLKAWRFLQGPVECRIGVWDHEGTRRAGPFRDKKLIPSAAEQKQMVLTFFNERMKEGIKGSAENVSKRKLHLYVAGAEEWRTYDSWPSTNQKSEILFLNVHLGLSPAPGPAGSAAIPLDPEAGAGKNNRWHAGNRGLVKYPGRIRGAVTWEGAPLPKVREIIGEGSLQVDRRGMPQAAALHAWLSAVSPEGKSVHLAEGVLNPSQAGAMILSPVAVRIPAKWRLRLEIASADTKSFEKLTRETLSVILDQGTFLVLPQ